MRTLTLKAYGNHVVGAVLSLAALFTCHVVKAADVPVKPDLPVKAFEKVREVPFFQLIDDRITVAWIPTATGPGSYTVNPDGSINGKTAKQVYAFTHFDIWAYGTNSFSVQLLKSDHNDPANPCTNAGVIVNPLARVTVSANCAGASEMFATFRSTFGWNEIFGTKAFTVGPLRNVSFQVGMDGQATNHYLAAARRAVVGGLQFQFDLPYKGFFNVSPLVSWNFSGHSGFTQCGNGFSGPIPGVNCLIDGQRSFRPTWAFEANYYMDLGFLPESIDFWSISGRAGIYGKKGYEANPLIGTPTAVEFNAEPIRLTFDASKAMWGKKYAHFLDVWVAYRYWQNKYGTDAAQSRVCNISPGVSNNTCTESSLYTGVSMKF